MLAIGGNPDYTSRLFPSGSEDEEKDFPTGPCGRRWQSRRPVDARSRLYDYFFPVQLIARWTAILVPVSCQSRQSRVGLLSGAVC